ncbi:2306_t:CDS:2, partial [Gigaspora rosea]
LDLNPIERPLSREEWRNDNHEATDQAITDVDTDKSPVISTAIANLEIICAFLLQ